MKPTDEDRAGERLAQLRRMLAGNTPSTEIFVPSGSLELKVSARHGAVNRTVRHIHQTCLFSFLGYLISAKSKWVYAVDAYLRMVDAGNPLGIYASARSLVEFLALVSFVHDRLNAAQSKEGWRAKGEEYFKWVRTARYGTSNPVLQERLVSQGLSRSVVKPLHVNDCLKALASHEGFDWLIPFYDFLSDYVHHNLSSNGVATESVEYRNEVSYDGTTFRFPEPMPGEVVKVPSRLQADYAFRVTIERTVEVAEQIQLAIGSTQPSPYTKEELLDLTGDSLGARRISSEPTSWSEEKKVPRNAPCPCGSGKKYKHCHGKP